ncbi:F-box protein SKIP23-like [Phoenix dactylifera]|uniref:F-box protein SKIP23-like n=1 Tax=Phoenix dactylifera TaxID=42345 RepID=A0A8B7D5I0_PHODC|nr:F-box protein SKIP23-like [Phoenix dactylifera]
MLSLFKSLIHPNLSSPSFFFFFFFPAFSPSMATPDWASLIPDLLLRISQNLLPCSFDYINFRSTCSGWRSAAPHVKFAPFLLFPFDSEAGGFSFYSPSDDRVYFKPFPEASSTVFCGSSHGWLVLMDELASISLLNPFTRARVQLPPADEQLALSSLKHVSKVGNRWFSRSEDGTVTLLTLTDMHQVFIKQVILSSAPNSGDGFIAVAALALSTQVAFCRRGDQRWTLLETTLSCDIKSIAFHNGRLFAMDYVGKIAVLEVDYSAGMIPIASLQTPPCLFNCKLVESKGDLLLVGLAIHRVDEENLYLERDSEIYKFNPGVEPVWSRVESIGDETLFLSLYFNSNVAGSRLSRCKGNSIYYSGPIFVVDEPTEPGVHHMEVVDLANGSSEMVPCHRPSQNSEFVSWFQPNLYLAEV